MDEFKKNNQELLRLIDEWEPKLFAVSDDTATFRRNTGSWSIKEIVGHMIDSASNNTHRIVHLQYQPSPATYPDYANFGNNDRWVAIQNYQEEKWHDLVQLWKYSNIHIVHVINNVDPDKLNNEWITGLGQKVSLKAMILDYPRHFKLHIDGIDDLMKMYNK
jgi:hypothetical protein